MSFFNPAYSPISRLGQDDGAEFIGYPETTPNGTAVTTLKEYLDLIINDQGMVHIGWQKRPFMSTGNRAITVDAAGGGDYLTLQEAVNQIPLILSHQFTINIADGTYAENVIVPLFFFERLISQDIGSNVKGFIDGLEIYGNQTTADHRNVKVGSITYVGGDTYRTKLEGMELYLSNPYADANASLEARRGAEVVIRNITFNQTGGTRACSAYGGIITVKEGVHLGTDVYSSGFTAKVGGYCEIASNDPAANPNSGSVTGNMFNGQQASFISVISDPAGATPYTYSQFTCDPTADVAGHVTEFVAGQKLIHLNSRQYGEAYGEFTGTTTAAGDLIFPHGLGVAPIMVQVTLVNSDREAWTVGYRFTPGTVNVTAYVKDETDAPVALTEVTVSWYARV